MTIIRKARKFLLDDGILYLYALFIAGYFLLPMAAGHRRVFYLLLMPAIALLWRELLAFCRDNALAWLVLLYAAYMLCTLAWTVNFNPPDALWALWLTLCVLGFVLLSGWLWERYQERISALLPYASWLAAGVALLSILVWYLQHPFPASRLVPLGVMHDPNESSCVYAMCMILALFQLYRGESTRVRVIYALVALILLALILFTQSRSSLLALCVALLVLLGYRALLVIAVAGAASWALVASNEALWSERVLGFSYRPGIWGQVWEQARSQLWFGQGYLVDTAVPAYDTVFNHAHNGYLATLRDGGLVGLALLLALLGLAAYRGWRLRSGSPGNLRSRSGTPLYLALLVFGATCIGMDFDRLLVQPKEIWLFFWLPVALIMGSRTDDRPGPDREIDRGPAQAP